jgi:hypothetical protein
MLIASHAAEVVEDPKRKDDGDDDLHVDLLEVCLFTSDASAFDRTQVRPKPEPESRIQRPTSAVDELGTLPPPPAFDLCIQGLSIGVPAPEQFLPLPVPIPVPRFLLSRKKKDLDYLTQTIIRDVNVKRGSGEVLAMYAISLSRRYFL